MRFALELKIMKITEIVVLFWFNLVESTPNLPWCHLFIVQSFLRLILAKKGKTSKTELGKNTPRVCIPDFVQSWFHKRKIFNCLFPVIGQKCSIRNWENKAIFLHNLHITLSPGQTDRQVVASRRKLNLGRDLRWVAKRTSKFPLKYTQVAKALAKRSRK